MTEVPLTHRIFKFYSVGLLGIGVQSGVLFLAVHVCGLHYLPATFLAVESAILHNFFWHAGWTFRHRLEPGTCLLTRLWRFNLATGASSLLGNLLLMAFLVDGLGFPILPSNLAAIAGCSLINYLASDLWAFHSNDDA
ncbi:MAG TPA: GtrA family protein [Acidobacteriota bacterium]|nr:GtrA family protein [Acidobacteriota bacterium]